MQLLSMVLWVTLTHFIAQAVDLLEQSCDSGNDQCVETVAEPTTLSEFLLEGELVRMITPSAIPSHINNDDSRCIMWAEMGLCSTDAEFMLRHCIPACFNSTIIQTHGLLTVGSYNKNRLLLKPSLEGAYLPDGSSCEDTFDPSIHLNSDEEGCENWTERGECHLNPKFMLKYCAKSCLVCVPSG